MHSGLELYLKLNAVFAPSSMGVWIRVHNLALQQSCNSHVLLSPLPSGLRIPDGPTGYHFIPKLQTSNSGRSIPLARCRHRDYPILASMRSRHQVTPSRLKLLMVKTAEITAALLPIGPIHLPVFRAQDNHYHRPSAKSPLF